jgi:hypothetical protein
MIEFPTSREAPVGFSAGGLVSSVFSVLVGFCRYLLCGPIVSSRDTLRGCSVPAGCWCK